MSGAKLHCNVQGALPALRRARKALAAGKTARAADLLGHAVEEVEEPWHTTSGRGRVTSCCTCSPRCSTTKGSVRPTCHGGCMSSGRCRMLSPCWPTDGCRLGPEPAGGIAEMVGSV